MRSRTYAPRVGAALITGAGRGLGLEIARALAARGLTVHLTDVDPDAAEAGARELGPPAFASGLDVRDAEACRAAAALTAERGGSLDVWVNNAGILVTGHVWEHDPETRRALFEVNTLGTINGTLAALELMRTAGRGHVVNVVSLAGLGAPPGEALYSATKHGAIAFSLGAAPRPATCRLQGDPRLGRLPGRNLDADDSGQARRPRRRALVLGNAATS